MLSVFVVKSKFKLNTRSSVWTDRIISEFPSLHRSCKSSTDIRRLNRRLSSVEMLTVSKTKQDEYRYVLDLDSITLRRLGWSYLENSKTQPWALDISHKQLTLMAAMAINTFWSGSDFILFFCFVLFVLHQCPNKKSEWVGATRHTK